MKGQTNISRRAFVSAGLGAFLNVCLSTPAHASSTATKKTGYSLSGKSIEGIVTVADKSYGYKAGKQQHGLVTINKNTYYFDEKTGEMRTGAIEIKGSWYHFDENTGILTTGFTKASDDSGLAYLSKGNGVLEKSGFLSTSVYDKNGKENLYYIDPKTHAMKTGYLTIDNETYYINDDYTIRNNCIWFDELQKTYNVFDADGKRTRYFIASNMAGWDFTDWDYIAKMAFYADTYDSKTDWFVTVDWNEPCRCVVFHREDNNWNPVCAWYCGVGRWYVNNSVPRGAEGLHEITYRWEKGAAGPGYCLDYIACYTTPYPSAEGDNSAAFHAGLEYGQEGYFTHSCVALVAERTQWMYYNIDWHTTTVNIGWDADIENQEFGYLGGYHDEIDVQTWMVSDMELDDPFGLNGRMPKNAKLSGEVPQP